MTSLSCLDSLMDRTLSSGESDTSSILVSDTRFNNKELIRSSWFFLFLGKFSKMVDKIFARKSMRIELK